MTDVPPPKDHRPPLHPDLLAYGKFFAGLVIGSILAGAALPVALIIAFTAGGEGRNPGGEALGFLPPAGVLLLIIVLSVGRKTRAFGLGMLAGVPVGVLALFVICGGLR